MGVIVSLGGLIFGYDTGQISGFLEMSNFLELFADDNDNGKLSFSDTRSGTIVGLLSIGTFIGVLAAGPIADFLGRKYSIVLWNIIFCVGVIVQISTETHWYQIATRPAGRRLRRGSPQRPDPDVSVRDGAEAGPRKLVSCYQLFITLGIFIAYCINYGTESNQSPRSWRLPMGIGFIWPVLMITGILFLPESPSLGVPPREDRVSSPDHCQMLRRAGEPPRRRSGAQGDPREARAGDPGLAGREAQVLGGPDGAPHAVSYPSRHGPPESSAADGCELLLLLRNHHLLRHGLSNRLHHIHDPGRRQLRSMTFFGLYVVEHFGRRKVAHRWRPVDVCVLHGVRQRRPLLLGSHRPYEHPQAGTAMIVFACLFIAAFAMTWGPIIWATIGELYPSRYRAVAMGLATSANWIWNFLISFFTPFITSAIDYRYGYIFAAGCFTGSVVVYFFLCESSGRTLEEIDTMYLLHIKPWESSKWQPEDVGDLVETDRLALTSGGRDIRKQQSSNPANGLTAEHKEEGEASAAGDAPAPSSS